ncbi:hypothetical protein [Streptomyces fagopyri]
MMTQTARPSTSAVSASDDVDKRGAEAYDRQVHVLGAAFVTNGLESEALRTDDPAATLLACSDSLAEVMPAVFRNLGMNAALLPILEPLIGERLRFMAALHQLRDGATDAYASVLDEILTAVREGAEVVALCDRVLDILSRVAASKAGK